MPKILLIVVMLLISLTSCKTVSKSNNGLFVAPVRPSLQWQDDGQRTSISKEDAVKLAHYFVDLAAYVKKTRGN
jgi:hypothetical protein